MRYLARLVGAGGQGARQARTVLNYQMSSFSYAQNRQYLFTSIPTMLVNLHSIRYEHMHMPCMDGFVQEVALAGNSSMLASELLLHFYICNSMEHAKQLSLPGVSKDFMNDADVLLVLDDGTAIPCHSQILSLHSTVLRNMIADLPASKRSERTNIPLADFTEAQCSALLTYLYSVGVSCRGAATANQDPDNLAAAAAVARFAHTYDAPHALRHVETYLVAYMDEHYQVKKSEMYYEASRRRAQYREGSRPYLQAMVNWTLMAEKYDMHELLGHCERAMIMYWECFHDKCDLVNQLSSGTVQRIAMGLSKTLLASEELKNMKYPRVNEFMTWRECTEFAEAAYCAAMQQAE